MAAIYHHVDAFTHEPFRGNPAGVCLLEQPRDPAWMQHVAAEVNLPETAFLRPLGENEWELRWFSPATEVELCGHATLASAHVLWEKGHAAPDKPIRFRTLYRGVLTCRREDDSGWIVMDFPADPPKPASPPPALIEALGGVEFAQAARSRDDWIIEVPQEKVVLAVQPDFEALKRIEGMRGCAVTARAARDDFDIVSRFFPPSLGVNEDPVTGSVHAALGPYWQPRLNRSTIRAYQASPRSGALRISLRGDRVDLAGQALTVLQGTLTA